MSDFVHLHLHTQYSILDGATPIEGLMDRAVSLGMPAVAITDHGNMFGIKHFFDAARAKKIKPILDVKFIWHPREEETNRTWRTAIVSI